MIPEFETPCVCLSTCANYHVVQCPCGAAPPPLRGELQCHVVFRLDRQSGREPEGARLFQEAKEAL